MKLNKTYFLLFLFYSSFSFSQNWHFEKSPTLQNIARLDMVSDSLGWAISYDGLLLKYEGSSWIVADTINSTSKYSFSDVDSSIINFDYIGDLYAIRVLDNKHGWIAVNNIDQQFYLLSPWVDSSK